VKRRPDPPGQSFSGRFPLNFAGLIFAAIAVCFVAGCKKPSPPSGAAAIRNITHELVLAARSAGGGRAEVGMRSEYAPRRPGKQRALIVDHIYITLPAGKAASPDRAAHDSVLAALDRVADYHHMERVERPGAPGLERFDYLMNGRRTQAIHLVTPLATRAETESAPGHARLAVVIDDLGYDRAQADSVLRIPYPLTVSVLPHESNSSEVAEEAHRRGYEVMLHLPVASSSGEKDEAIELHPGMNADAVENTFAEMLDTVPYAAGVNNHEGSLGTADPQLMNELMPVLRRHNLFFVDSRTTTATVAETEARAAGVPTARRNVFLDNEQAVPAIRKQFELAIRDAKEKGSALAIGHPHPETIEALNEMLPAAERAGVRLVFASDLAR
jgi:uncharacterized protein